MSVDFGIRLRARSGGEDAFRELDPVGANGGFSELRETTFVGPPHRECRLFIDDERLDRVADSVNEWSWKPGFYAGEVRAELLGRDDRSLGVWRLDVSPDPDKAGRELFARMLHEIAAFDARLVVGEEPARQRLGALGETDDPLVLFERLRCRRRDLERALTAIRREPVSVLRSRRGFVPLRDVRRADRRTVRSLLRQPAALAVVARGGATGSPRGGAGDPTLDVPAVERTLDSPANRCAFFMLRALRLRCRALAGRLEKLASKPAGETRTAIANRVGRWKQILGEMERGFAAAEHGRPFREVRRPEITAAGLNAVAAHPLYARFWRVGWEALRRGVHRLDPQDLLPLSPTWEIYERWCFVALAGKLREWLPDHDWKQKSAPNSDRRTVIGARKNGHHITLDLQRAFGGTKGRERVEGWSVSRQCVPDLVLASRPPGGETRFVVLDAKYRAGEGEILGGMAESAHLYQDALRWGARRPESTLLLVPNAEATAWLTSPEYVAKHHVGVVALCPDVEPPAWFRELVIDLAGTAANRG